jgi:hypothetical protein
MTPVVAGELSSGNNWERTYTLYRQFRQAFSSPPSVITAISLLDQDDDHNVRISVYAANVTTVGFNLIFRTWNNTKVYGVASAWTAIGF